MKLLIDENGIIVLHGTDGINVPAGIPIPVRLERFTVVDGAIELDPAYVGMSNETLDAAIVAANEAVELELARTHLLDFAGSKRAGKVLTMLMSVDGVVDTDSAGYAVVCAANERSYEDAVAGLDVFMFSALTSGQTQTEYRAAYIAQHEARDAKKKEMMDLIDGLNIHFRIAIETAVSNEELIDIKNNITKILEMRIGGASVEAIRGALGI